MPLFTITTTARADISETWQIEAANEEQAREWFEECPDGQVAVLIEDSVDGNEEEREITSIELAEMALVPRSDRSDAAAKVWITQGEHFSVPGCPISVHASEESANVEAAALINIMLKDSPRSAGKPKAATASDWAGVPMGWLQDYHGAAHCWVDVSAHTVREA